MSTKLEASLVGLITCTTPYILRETAKGVENGTRPLDKDEVVEQLKAAADAIETLNETLMKVVKELP